MNETTPLTICCDCLDWLSNRSLDSPKFALTFLDPPFNQGKHYRSHDDLMPEEEYWAFMAKVCKATFDRTIDGGSVYFMQREKNSERVLSVLRESGWTFQNLIIWKKLTSAVPSNIRFGKAFQIIVFATKGARALTFNKLRIAPKLPQGYRPHVNGVYVTDIWDDIRELTSGYFAGDEAMRNEAGDREHKQQSPVNLLLRIILSSTLPGMLVLDPFAGSGTTSVVASQLDRPSIALEIDEINIDLIKRRLCAERGSDAISRFRSDYEHTACLDEIWPLHLLDTETNATSRNSVDQVEAGVSPPS